MDRHRRAITAAINDAFEDRSMTRAECIELMGEASNLADTNATAMREDDEREARRG